MAGVEGERVREGEKGLAEEKAEGRRDAGDVAILDTEGFEI
jgi:hypothetical protein